MDRATKIAEFIGKKRYLEAWSKIAREIKQDILKKGWSVKRKSFSMYYGSHSLDAANLLMLHYGFLERTDRRMISTVKQTYRHLVHDDLTFRYSGKDDFGMPQNAFIVCSFWMINALYLIGEREKATKMFEKIVGCCNHLGLLSEDVETATKRLTGNFPQGYSHLALMQTILLFDTGYNWSDEYKSRG
jgi:GH15 family glucan-1,4-alpha-glucosidase